MKFERICIIGLGLMGGSLALSLKNKDFQGTIVGYDTSINCLTEAFDAGAIDIAAKSLQDAAAMAQLVVIAVPIGNFSIILKEISGFLTSGCIVTDVGSVKGHVVKLAKEILPPYVYFVGGHPMAGSERGGFSASNPFLYENAYYFLTPEENTPHEAVRALENIVVTMGAYPVVTSSQEHDYIVSRISHLPHLIAMLLVNLIEQDKDRDYMEFIGGGFRDTTRIASGSPNMWRDIFLVNKEELINSTKAFEQLLKDFRSCLESEHKEQIFQSLESAKQLRDSMPKKGRGYISQLFELIVSIEDKPGVLGKITGLIAAQNINIKEIEILHSRQGEAGAVRLALESEEAQNTAMEVLRKSGFAHVYSKGEVSRAW